MELCSYRRDFGSSIRCRMWQWSALPISYKRQPSYRIYSAYSSSKKSPSTIFLHCFSISAGCERSTWDPSSQSAGRRISAEKNKIQSWFVRSLYVFTRALMHTMHTWICRCSAPFVGTQRSKINASHEQLSQYLSWSTTTRNKQNAKQQQKIDHQTTKITRKMCFGLVFEQQILTNNNKNRKNSFIEKK